MSPISPETPFNATPEEVMRAVEQLQEFCEAHGVDAKTSFALQLSLEELASNIVNHAYSGNPEKKFWVGCEHGAGSVRVSLRDQGPGFNPIENAPPIEETPDEDRAEGGWGIQLVLKYMDQVEYLRLADGNCLLLTKRLPAASPESSNPITD